MKEILVICRNCGEVERYDIDYMTSFRKKHHNCSKCGNRTQEYENNRKWANQMIKKNHQQTIELLEQDKYNKVIFGNHKGFDYKKI